MQTSVAVTRSPTRLWWSLAGVALVGGLVFGLVRWPSSEPAPTRPDEEAAVAGDDGDQSDPDGASTRPDVDDPPAADEDRPDDEAFEADAADPGDGEVATIDSLIGQATGLVLAFGSADGPVGFVDLDTGEEWTIPVRGTPQGLIGTDLVTESEGRILVVDLTEPDREPVLLADQNAGGFADFATVRGGLVWLLRSAGPAEDRFLIQSFTPDGDLTSEREIDPWFGFLGSQSAVGGELVNGSSGGIYRWTDGVYLREAEGRLLAVGEDLVLAHQCDEVLRCRNRWLYRDDLTAGPDLPAPPSVVGAAYDLVGGDRWLFRLSWANGSQRLIDVATGEELPVDLGERFGSANRFAVSDDGRWLVSDEGVYPVITDLESLTPYRLETRAGFESSYLFVDRSVFASGAAPG